MINKSTKNKVKFQVWIILAQILFFLMYAESSVQAEVSVSVQEFLQMKGQWKDLEKKKTLISIEGRINSFSKKAFRFSQCKMFFRSSHKKGFGTNSIKSNTVEVHGYLKKTSSGDPPYYFEVKSLSAIASDSKVFESKNKFLKENPEKWTELGQWALKRSLFYDDNDLKIAGEEAIYKAYLIKFERVPLEEYKPLFFIIEEIENQKFETFSPSEKNQKFRHEAYRRWWNEVKSNNLVGIEKLKKEVEENLKGCEKPINSKEYKLKVPYEKSPVQYYNQADIKTKPILHRLFYIEILYETIMSHKKSDGSNGYQIAELLDKQIPEIKGVQDKFRISELNLRKKRIQTFTRAEILDLAKKYEDRNDISNKKKVLKSWLEMRAAKEKKEGPAGLILIARDYRLLLNDNDSAYELLILAYDMNPESEEIAQSLRKIGYELHKGEWKPASEVEPTEVSKIQKAMKSGEVVIGMTMDQVSKTLGKPESVSRAVSVKEIDIVWLYGELTGTRLIIRFVKLRNSEKEQLKVLSISQIINQE